MRILKRDTEVEFTRREAKFHCDQRDGDSY